MPEHLHYMSHLWNWDEIIASSRKPAVILWVSMLLILLAAYLYIRRKRMRYPPISHRRPHLLQIKDYLACVVLFLFSLLINLSGIHNESLSTMEGTYLMEATRNQSLVAAIVNRDGIMNSHMPLYRTLIYIFLMFGHSTSYIRGISAVAGALGTGLLYVFCINILSRPLAGLCALLFLLSPIHVYFSQSIMPYALLSGLVFGYYAAFLHLSLYPSRASTVVYVLMLALGLNTHVVFLGELLPPFVWILYRLRRSEDRQEGLFLFYLYLEKTLLAFFFLLPFAAMQLAYLKYFTEVFPQMMAYLDVVPHLSELPSRTLPFFIHIFSLCAGFFPAKNIPGFLSLIVFLAATLLVLRSRRIEAFLFGSGPMLILLTQQFLVFTYLKQVNFEVRYYCFAPAFFWITILLVFDQFGKHIVRSRAFFKNMHPQAYLLAYLACGLLLLLPCLTTLLRRPNYTLHPDLKSLSTFLHERIQPGDALCVTPAPFFADVLLYHLSEPWHDLYSWSRNVASLQANVFPNPKNPQKNVALITNSLLPWEQASRSTFFERIWLIYIHEHTLGYSEYSNGPYQRVKADYEKHCVPEGRWTFSDVEVLRYRPEFRIPGWEAHSFTLLIGKDDYPYIKGFWPPITSPSSFRCIPQEAIVRVPVYRDLKSPRVLLYLSRKPGTKEDALFSFTCSLGGERIQSSYPIAGISEGAEQPLEIRCPVNSGERIEISFSIQPGKEDPGNTDSCVVRLYRVEFIDRE